MTFGGKVRLARHVDPDERDGNYVSYTAFSLSPEDLKAKQPYLSVNSTQMEPIVQIIEIYRNRQQGKGDVAVSIKKVYDYVKEGRSAGAQITSRRGEHQWIFPDMDGNAPAFLHRPNQSNNSHCGVEFLRSLEELQQRDFARSMARHPGMQVSPATVRRTARRR